MSELFAAEAEEDGPFVTAALICERVLREDDGALSAVRMVDMVTLTPIDEPIPEGTAALATGLRLFLLVSFKGGVLGSQHVLTVIGHSPSGASETFPPSAAELNTTVPGAAPGFNVIVHLQMGMKSQGVYWFEVRLDDRKVTAVPLLVAFAPPAPHPEPTTTQT
jgi:hypothetical protein